MGKCLLLEFQYEETLLKIFKEKNTFKAIYNFSPELDKNELTDKDIFIEKSNTIIDLLNIISLNHSQNLFLFIRELKVYESTIFNSMELKQRFIFKFHEQYCNNRFLLIEQCDTNLYSLQDNIIEELYFADVYSFSDIVKGKYKSKSRIIHNCIMEEPYLYTQEYTNISIAIKNRLKELRLQKISIELDIQDTDDAEALNKVNEKIELLHNYTL